MPIATNKTITATSPVSQEEQVDLLQSFAASKYGAFPYTSGDVVEVRDNGGLDRTHVHLLRPVGVVVSCVVDGAVQVAFHNVDGHEMIMHVMPAFITKKL